MDLNKSREFFDPKKVRDKCHIIGCGSIGSNVAELLARYGVEDIVLWDFDNVEPHNIANQLFYRTQVNMKKTDALADILMDINKNIKIKKKEKYTSQILDGYVFMCVDNVEVRQQILEYNKFNPNILAVFDFRTTLLEGQTYFVDWRNDKQKKSLITSLDFTHEEAKENTPVSACGFELSVSPVVKITAIMGIVNFTNFINKEPTKHIIIIDPYSYAFTAV